MLNHKIIKNLTVVAFSCLLTACGFFDKDNTPTPTPLTTFSPQIKPHLLWSTRTGSGAGDENLRLTPAVTDTAIFTTASSGVVASVDKLTGHLNWQVNSRVPVTTGPGAGEGIIVFGSRRGDVMALRQADGRSIWKTSVDGEVLANPAVGHNEVIVKSVDGYVRALSIRDGHELWSFQQVEPSLILRGASSPLIKDNAVIVGFANGNLVKANLYDGRFEWLQTIAFAHGAFAIQRMIDIDADPIVFQHHIYAATYQGNIASLDWSTGQTIWSHDISSYTGMVADDNNVYISDAKGHVWAFDAAGGSVKWRQNRLEARVISGPAAMGNYIVVGDGEGYLHWLNKRDGFFAARESVGGAVTAAPIVDNNHLYALTNKGYLVAYTIDR